MVITSVNPATEEAIATFELHTADQVDQKLTAAVSAQRVWRRTPVEERTALLTRIAEVLREGAEEYAQIITREMGKPITEARAEIEKCAVTLDYYAEQAPAFLADEPIASNASESGVVFDPLGVVLAIMPWNYPFWQFFRFAAPALAAGNAPFLKHANNVPESALAVEEIVRKAGAPEGLCTTVLIESHRVAGLIEDDRIAAVTLTGSTQVGRIVASQAGKALKKQVLELGGSDPFIVLAGADIAQAARVAVKARFTNVGQSCVNAKRFIVEESVADEFVAAFVKHASALKVGDPSEGDTHIGPLARGDLRDELHDQVLRTLEHGRAVLKLGGAPLEGPGYFYPPTIIDHVEPGDTAFEEETFGPVAAIIRARDVEHAVELANDTEFGLGAALWTQDLDLARTLTRRIDAGAVFVNGMVVSDARLPFGGIKASGYGRELGDYGLREFVNIKTVWIGPASDAAPVAAEKIGE
ncbi:MULTISPECIES: NAD-dependent succinate-semialdehyde dehydrogenase [unclassified Microbacterium]|uniref:NAD-dependent succinate-semialdehyde dehydrogenase n=1 Tax=unclassified Microbacterium TaxID=2609290 RepID=UPI00214D0545|nr:MULTISPECIES: NAD-dependent succinate-semialdehyde dehydrogenase [unclassified Microbacterium]MCR2800389.1 NAD-dependent succinate-semialdehyde dehydrogenase [Microbacterium sp. zg.Y818]MCR2825892.1 NAD-dependent succinate-semialdehyde dehydrogenase [Microbacterium sp. zg.Y909]WIM22349.1 NAD-dependent succinate-semialdehyde dehydrogenase [Microbacterium sp. zg-Y818]